MVVCYSTDQVAHGIDPETPITLEVSELRALEVLERVLEQCAVVEPCTWQLRSSFLEVGTKERLAVDAAQEVRTYPIDDLLFEAPRFEDAPGVGFGFGYSGYDPYGYPDGAYPGGFYGRYAVPSTGVSGAFGGSFAVTSGPGNSAEERAARAEQLIESIIDTVEPTAWLQNGGSWAAISYRDGALVVRGPDFIQRHIGGYPRVSPPVREKATEGDEGH
jgi:hypothetical protein